MSLSVILSTVALYTLFYKFTPAADATRWEEGIMKEADNLLDTIRKNIIETLMILSSREEQSNYPVPVEWFCFWFDDHYLPQDTSFQKAFSDTELEILSEFNTFFESASEKIGDPPSTPDELSRIPVWDEVIQKANETLNKLKGA